MLTNFHYTIFSIVASLTVITVGVVVFQLFNERHQENLVVIEKCFANFDEKKQISLEKESFWSPVTCTTN